MQTYTQATEHFGVFLLQAGTIVCFGSTEWQNRYLYHLVLLAHGH